ncbi:polyketide cyclase/dehydrase/lipid transport protein [Knoellia remsis]|uniref:Polyketide cyclase/dehydrase/lipid transport protein n=1 Tax=Knoellia remsis TaxID=407159 RepID=A0A2T0U7Y7_9MICO|nr:SRPBCC family protein [Knoellia remsis]PRY54036.1 polyketide cyclase/dehydrase/lipid transport protein [Knoellia remsis]
MAQQSARKKPDLEESIEVAAPPSVVWSLVSEPTVIAAQSPQVVRTIVRGRPVTEGTRMINLNRSGFKVWPTRAKVVEADPERRFAFRVKENATIWSFELEPTATGTRLTHKRENPTGTTALSDSLVDRFLGGQERFTRDLTAGMKRTLAGIKKRAEATSR